MSSLKQKIIKILNSQICLRTSCVDISKFIPYDFENISIIKCLKKTVAVNAKHAIICSLEYFLKYVMVHLSFLNTSIFQSP